MNVRLPKSVTYALLAVAASTVTTVAILHSAGIPVLGIPADQSEQAEPPYLTAEAPMGNYEQAFVRLFDISSIQRSDAEARIKGLEAVISAFDNNKYEDPSKEALLSNAFNAMRNATVHVEASRTDNDDKVYGTGVFVAPDYVLTAAHLLLKNQDIMQTGGNLRIKYSPLASFMIFDSSGESHPVDSALVNPFTDTAVLHITRVSGVAAQDLSYAKLRPRKTLKRGEPVWLASRGLPPPDINEVKVELRQGTIDTTTNNIVNRSIINPVGISIVPYKGSSGSGIYDRAGNLLGIMSQLKPITGSNFQENPGIIGSYLAPADSGILLMKQEVRDLKRAIGK